MDKEARLSMLAANVEALGDMPAATGFDAWRLAWIEAQIEAAIPTGREVPLSLLQERQSLVRQTIDCGSAEGPLMSRPLFQAMAAKRVNGLRASVEAGDGGAVLEAVSVCLSHGLVTPGWLASAFVLRVERVTVGDAKDWGDGLAFGRAVPQGTNQAGIRARMQAAPAAWEAALDLLTADPSRPLDKGFYEAVGARIGYGATEAERLVRRHVGEHPGIWPALSALKPLLASGCDLAEALCSLRDEHDLAAWRAAGRTDDEWRELTGQGAEADAPGNVVAFPGLQK